MSLQKLHQTILMSDFVYNLFENDKIIMKYKKNLYMYMLYIIT